MYPHHSLAEPLITMAGGEMHDEDIERIEEIIAKKAERFRSRMGDVVLADIEGGTVRIAPSGFCWR